MAEDNPIDLFDSRSVRYTGGEYADERFEYRLLKPVEVVSGREYPLLLFLHGADQRGNDNRAQIKHLPGWMADADYHRRYPCFLVAPQCRAGKQWVETPRAFDRSAPRQEAGPQMAVAIKILDDVLASFPIDHERLYLTGLSLGGYGSWDLGTRLADRWAAVAPICGGGDELYADRLVGVPVWAWHGSADEVVPAYKSRRMIDAIRAAGGDPKYTELAGVGHDSWTPAYRGSPNVLEWMFAQRKGAAVADSGGA